MSHCGDGHCRVCGPLVRPPFHVLWAEACRRATELQRRLAATWPEREARLRQSMAASEKRARKAVLVEEARR